LFGFENLDREGWALTDALDTLLLEKGGLTAEDLQQARAVAAQKNISLGRALRQHKAITELDLLDLLADYFGHQFCKTLPRELRLTSPPVCPLAS
jgi:hypothetical protein